MSLKLSTCLRNKLLGMQAVPVFTFNENYPAVSVIAYETATTILTDAAYSFITNNVAPGMLLYTVGSTTAGNDISDEPITGVVAATLTLAGATFTNFSEPWVPGTTGVVCTGGSLKDVFMDGVLRIYTGSAPASADTAVSGTLICEITVSSGAFVAGAFDNGLEFGAAASGVIAKAAAETWSGVGINGGGTAGYFRLVGNAADTGVLDSGYIYPRIQGTIGTSGADLNMTSTTITVGATYTIDTFQLTLPEYYGA